MKKLKRIIASASAAAMAASALLAAVPASAASVEKEIAYTGPSEGALAFENDGSSTISCLILSTNINAYQYADSAEIDEMGAAAAGITFNIDKVTTMAEETEPDPDVPVGTIGTATIIGNIGATGVWGADEITEGSKTANIDGDAQYEVVWNVTDGGTDTLEFLAVQIPGLSSDKYENLAVKVDGVYIDGKAVENYETSAAAIDLNYVEGTAATRIYLIDQWAGTGVEDLAADTAITQSLKVVFTVSGTGKDGTSNVAKYEKGDITRDGVVDLYDAIEIAKYMMNMIDIDEEQMEVGDINNDGVVDLYDAIEVARTLLPKK